MESSAWRFYDDLATTYHPVLDRPQATDDVLGAQQPGIIAPSRVRTARAPN
jgi:hypothetical protein